MIFSLKRRVLIIQSWEPGKTFMLRQNLAIEDWLFLQNTSHNPVCETPEPIAKQTNRSSEV